MKSDKASGNSASSWNTKTFNKFAFYVKPLGRCWNRKRSCLMWIAVDEGWLMRRNIRDQNWLCLEWSCWTKIHGLYSIGRIHIENALLVDDVQKQRKLDQMTHLSLDRDLFQHKGGSWHWIVRHGLVHEITNQIHPFLSHRFLSLLWLPSFLLFHLVSFHPLSSLLFLLISFQRASVKVNISFEKCANFTWAGFSSSSLDKRSANKLAPSRPNFDVVLVLRAKALERRLCKVTKSAKIYI